MRHTVLAALSAATLVSITACSATASVESESAEPSPPPLSAAWSCEEIPESPDGRYDVDQAGRVRISADGDDLVSVEAAASPAYGSAESRLYDTAAEVEFRHREDGSRVMLRVELGDNRSDVQICRS